MPCLEGMMRNVSRRAKAESEFNALVDMVSDAVCEHAHVIIMFIVL